MSGTAVVVVTIAGVLLAAYGLSEFLARRR
jgi:hypothetical protein